MGEWRAIEITLTPRLLAARIERRTRDMFDHGLVEETATLLAAGHEGALRALRAIGYEEAMDLLAGRLSRAEALARTNTRTRQLAKRQRTWFRHQIQAVRVDAAVADEEALLALALEAARG